MTKQYTVQAPDGKTITLEGPDGATQEEVIAQAQKLYVPQQDAEPTPPPNPLQSTPAQGILGAQPSDLLERLKGVGRTLGRTGLGALQYGQYLTGSKITPTPISLEPSPDPNQQIGEKLGSLIPAAALGGGSLPTQTAVSALMGGLADQAEGGTGTTGALVGGAVPSVLKGAGAAASAVSSLKEKAAPLVNRWLQVPIKEFQFGADPGMRLVKEGLVKATKAQTQAAIAPVLDEAGQALDAKLAAATSAGTKIDAGQIVLDATNTATKTIGKRSDKAFQAALTNVFDDILNQFPDINNLTPERAQELKIAVGDGIKWHGAAYEGDINSALVDIYRNLNQEIKAKIPGIADAQARWGDLYLANKFAEASRLADKAGAGTGGLNPLIKTGIGVATGGAVVEGAHRLLGK